MSERSDPSAGFKAVTKSDTTVLNKGCRALYIGVSGDVAVYAWGSTTSVVFKSVPVGILPISVDRVLSTGTTASEIIALW